MGWGAVGLQDKAACKTAMGDSKSDLINLSPEPQTNKTAYFLTIAQRLIYSSHSAKAVAAQRSSFVRSRELQFTGPLASTISVYKFHELQFTAQHPAELHINKWGLICRSTCIWLPGTMALEGLWAACDQHTDMAVLDRTQPPGQLLLLPLDFPFPLQHLFACPECCFYLLRDTT